jgi:hypothetical protein
MTVTACGLRALIAVLWRAGLRISDALNETDIDAAHGSLLIRHGKGDKRREVGMDQFGFEQLAAWTAHRVSLPVGPLFCVIDGPTRGWRWAATAARCELRQPAAEPRGSSPVRAASAASRAHGRARARRRGGEHHPTPTRPHRPRNHVDLPTRHRSLRDHRRGPIPTPANHLSDRGSHAVTSRPLAEQESGRCSFPFDQHSCQSRSDGLAAGPATMQNCGAMLRRTCFRAMHGSDGSS